MKQLLLTMLTLTCFHRMTAQVVYTIKADSVKITNCDSAELIIENHTQGVPGFLYNTGKGRTIFKQPLTMINDSLYLVGGDSLKISNPNAWLQGGNYFGATGVLGTYDNHNLDFYTANVERMRIDSAGHLLFGGIKTFTGYYFDAVGPARFSNLLAVSVNDPYNVSVWGAGALYTDTVHSSGIAFGSIYASVTVNKSTLGNIPQGSLVIGGPSPGRIAALVDYAQNPVYELGGAGGVVINGGYSAITTGGTVGVGTNASSYNFLINGGLGTGTGTPGDIIISTGTAQSSGSTIHAMTNRWWIKGGTGYLSNTSSPTSLLDLTGANGYSQFRLRTSYTPTSSSDSHGNVGDFSWDTNYFYIKTTSGWERAPLSTF
jgi:hypothetical protein